MTANKPTDQEPLSAAALDAFAQRLTLSAGLAFFLAMLMSALSLRCLYADGSYQLTRVLTAGSFTEIAKNRECASYVYQLPVVLALKLGIHNLHFLEIAFGLGCFLPWPLCLACCHALAPRHFWLAMWGCGAGYLNAGFMPVGEYNVAHAFVWPVLFAVFFVRPLTPAAAVALLLSGIILLFSYESLFFLGPPLAIATIGRVVCGREKPWAKCALALAALLLVAAAGIALDGILNPECPNNLGGFQYGVWQNFKNPTWTTVWTGIWLLVTTFVSVSGTGFTRKNFRLEQALMAGAIILWSCGPLFHPGDTGAERQYEQRSLQLLVPLVLLFVAWASTRARDWFAARWGYLTTFAAALLLAQSLWLLAVTWQWHGFVGLWRAVLASHHGPVPLAQTPFSNASVGRQTLNFEWTWANPTLSIMLAPGNNVQAMILPDRPPPWQPFDPANPQTFPDLQKFGITYQAYAAAITAKPSTTK